MADAAIGAVMRSVAERTLGAATWEEWNASPQRRACFGEHRGAGRLQRRLPLVAYRLFDGLPSLPRWRETGVMVAGMAIGAASGALPRGDLAQRLARSGMHRRSGDAHVSDHRGADRPAGSPVLPACRPLDRRPSPRRREMGSMMAGMGYRRSQMEHCPEEGLAPRRTEEVECLAASEGARFGDHPRAGRLQRRLPLAAYRLLRRPSPSSLCGSGPIMAGYRCSQMEHCREDGSCDVQRRDAEPERRGLWRPSGRGPGCGFVCLCRRAVLSSVHRRCASPKRSRRRLMWGCRCSRGEPGGSRAVPSVVRRFPLPPVAWGHPRLGPPVRNAERAPVGRVRWVLKAAVSGRCRRLRRGA